MVTILSEIGEGKISGDKLTSIDWVDIKAWIDVMDESITHIEASALKQLSGAYVSQYYAAMEPDCPSPNIERPKDKDVIAGKIKSMFAMLRN